MRLIDLHDAALFDLDGVVYLGPEAVDGAPEVMTTLRAGGIPVAFVTNNAARPPAVVADQLRRLGIPCEVSDVVTSAQAITALMARQLPTDAKVLVIGTQALVDEVHNVGLRVVDSFTDAPDAVVQGYHPTITWDRFNEAAHAIQRGARWFMSNTDINRPTNLGLVPGAGAQTAAVASCVDVEPVIAGKPCPPLLEATIQRVGCQSPIFVGDRLDTDIEGANNVSIPSLLVFTGSHGKHDLLVAPAHQRPTAIGASLAALLEPVRVAEPVADGWACGATTATAQGDVIELRGVEHTMSSQLDGLWALSHLVWQRPGLDVRGALGLLDLVP